MLRRFVDDWNRDRPRLSPSEFGRDPGTVTPFSAVGFLARESGVPESTIEGLVGSSRATARLETADPLVAALGHPEAFHDGTLRVGLVSGGQFVPLDD